MDNKNLTQSHNSRVYENFLMHWKYIKREKVGDKWKYYYDDGTKTGAAAYEAKSAAERVRSKLDTVNSTIDIKNKAILDRNKKIVDAKMEQKALVDKNRQRIAEGKATINTVYERGKAKNAQLTAEYQKELLMEEKTALEKEKAELETELAKLEKEASDLEKQYNQSPAAKGYSTGDKIKDALGVDERNAYNEAKRVWKNASERKHDSLEKLGSFQKAYDDVDHWDKRYPIERENELFDDYLIWKEITENRGREYAKAKSEYMETPLGTALKVTETIKDIPFEVEYALEKLSKKLKKK